MAFVTIGAGAFLASAQLAVAVPADPNPIELQQPDGAGITLYIRGDERFHWYQDSRGYTVVRNKDAYVYAELGSDGRLRPTSHHVGRTDPAEVGLAPHTLPPTDVLRTIRANALKTAPSGNPGAPERVPPHGTVKNLVVLCRFSDHSLNSHTRLQSEYDILFNNVGGHPTIAPTGSVRDLYHEDSYGQVTLVSTVVPWVTLPHDEAYYTTGQSGFGDYPQNAQGMVQDALDLVDQYVDFGEYDSDNDGYIDAITIIHSGYGDESTATGNRIWSHKWSLWQLPEGAWVSQDSNLDGEKVKVYDYHTEPALWGYNGRDIVRFAVIAHETGHFFGLPDLYDTQGMSEGIGSYCMMSNSWGFDNTQYYPPHFSAWCKAFLGWVEPTVITEPGMYVAPQVETTPTVYRININYPLGEYLLIENRQPVGHESSMPQGGLCIWHVDETKYDNTDPGYPGQTGWPENDRHYKVALLQADGDFALEQGWNRGDDGDVYHGDGVDRIDETTIPNTNAYRDGNIITTYNTIRDIGPAGENMQFKFETYVDCNGNNTSDFDDIGIGSSIDCNSNAIPDECEADCNANGIHDDCDVTSGLADDCQGDGIPDDCQIAGTDMPFTHAADHCSDALAVTNGFIYNGRTNDASNDGSTSCGTSSSTADVWYYYKPTADGELTISLAGSGYDTVLSVHNDCPGTRDNQVACNDDVDGSSVQSEITVSVQMRNEYYIRVSGWSGSVGEFMMQLSGPAGAPSASDCNANNLPDSCEDLLPKITKPPSNQLVALGQTAEFSVEAQGMNLSYQWQRDGQDINGATQSVLRIENAHYNDMASYRVKIFSPCGNTKSSSAVLTVKLGLFVDIQGNGQVQMNPPGGVYAENTVVSLTPMPGEGWQFLEWSGGALGNGSPMYVLVLGNTNVGVRFVPTHNILTILKEGEGEVAASPSGGDYSWGQNVALRATAATGWRFAGWKEYTGSDRSTLNITMNGNLTVTAQFELLSGTDKPGANEPQANGGFCGNVGPALIPLTGVIFGIAPLLRRKR